MRRPCRSARRPPDQRTDGRAEDEDAHHETLGGRGQSEVFTHGFEGAVDDAGVVAEEQSAERSINGDIGDLNLALDPDAQGQRDAHLDALVELAVRTRAGAVVLPCGAQDHDPIESLDADLDRVAEQLIRAADRANARGVDIWVEALHFFRLCWNIDRAAQLAQRLTGTTIGIVMDFSHIVAFGGDPVEFVTRFGPLITHVHIRDAVPGDIHRSVGAGETDFAAGFAALADAGYQGHFALELETRDITDDQRAGGAVNAGTYVAGLL